MADSTPIRFSAGSAPGRPRQTGQTWVLGSAPNTVEQPQNILVAVFSSTWTSRPITGSNRSRAVSKSMSSVVDWVIAPAPPRSAGRPIG